MFKKVLLAIGIIASIAVAQYYIGTPYAGDVTASFKDGTMTISGTGKMIDFGSSNPPWSSSIGKNITSVVIKNGVTNIGSSAFSGHSSLTSANISNSVTIIGDNAFFNSSLNSVNIPESVTNIGQSAFKNCNLTSVNIPNSVTIIGNSAFSGCRGLTSVNITEAVTIIGDSVFSFCESLTSVYIPEAVTSIGSFAFYACTRLTSVNIPNNVTIIGNSAFQHCNSLTSVTIGNSVTSIGIKAFQYCNSLTSVNIPNSVKGINPYAFDYCNSLTSVTIPESVTTIGDWAFSNCSGLTRLTSSAKTPPSAGLNTFSYVTKTIPVYVPEGSIELYKKADGWSAFTNIIGICQTHNFGDWKTTTNATCEAAGEKTEECSVCGILGTQTQTIPQLTGEECGGGTSIVKVEKTTNKSLFRVNPVSDKMEIMLDDRVSFVVYDMTGNVVVFNGNGKVWDLRNSAGRFVANGTYLVVVEATDRNGKTVMCSAKVGVKR